MADLKELQEQKQKVTELEKAINDLKTEKILLEQDLKNLSKPQKNYLSIKAELMDIKFLKGSQKKNSDGSLKYNDDGTPDFWEDKTFCQFGVTGGKFNVSLESSYFSQLKVGEDYILEGICVAKTKDDKGYLLPDFRKVTLID